MSVDPQLHRPAGYCAICSNSYRGWCLEAAVPLIVAQALRDVADEVYGDERAQGPYAEPLSIASWLRSRADEIEAGR